MSRTPNVRTRRRVSRKSGAFADVTREELSDMYEAGRLSETSRVDEIVHKYTGAAVQLDEAFPEPPSPQAPHAALSGAVRLPESNLAYNRPNPADAEALAAENAYRREHELKMVHRLMLRNATMPQIANALDKSLHYVLALRHELERRHAAEASNLNVMAYSASSIGFYNEMRGIALRNVDTTNLSHAEKARYMALAIAAENNKHRFLQLTGFYDGAPMRPQAVDDGDSGREMAILTGALKAMMDPEAYEHSMGEVLDAEDNVPLANHDPEDYIRVL